MVFLWLLPVKKVEELQLLTNKSFFVANNKCIECGLAQVGSICSSFSFFFFFFLSIFFVTETFFISTTETLCLILNNSIHFALHKGRYHRALYKSKCSKKNTVLPCTVRYFQKLDFLPDNKSSECF